MLVTQGSIVEILVFCRWLFCPRDWFIPFCESVEFEWIGERKHCTGCLQGMRTVEIHGFHAYGVSLGKI